KFHEKYGGVVPEIASRQHLTTLPLMVKELFKSTGINNNDLSAIAVTNRPGLIGSLLVGASYAKSLAWLLGIDLIGIDHLEGHLLAPFLDHADLTFPYLALIASGGHTHLFIAKAFGDYELIGRTMDDAAGEAYDKIAKMLGFKYPGGPVIDKIALDYKNPDIEFPIPLRGKKTLDFSFSGLKTAVLKEATKRNCYFKNQILIDYQDFLKSPQSNKKEDIKNIAASFQKCMEEIISQKIQTALKLTDLKKIVITGGVASNVGIRKKLEKTAFKFKAKLYYPDKKHCTDNAAMIGYTAYCHLKNNHDKASFKKNLMVESKSSLAQMDIKNLFNN
ncbi:MAG: tRNA (adenosine(37)-N6)-threonylcarbamoyltransferase complex transferase subunit TsaD, partial [Flavobacteriaceae bacterium]|nr:tRNA (adenosine(37)-N6)-threonylcarbamoyltransferase complex transferase subunit TsaD [Flavobacteriaceae bacterium]